MPGQSKTLKQRRPDAALLQQKTDLHPILQRVFSARQISGFDETRYSLSSIIPPQQITQLEQAAHCLASHLQKHSTIIIFGDYDADGATSTALCIKALDMLGQHNASFMLPHRSRDGYGVSSGVAQRLITLNPNLVITVDTGIASFNGLSLLQQAGIDVIVTDHHLPAEQLPSATVIVNPNAYKDGAGKNLAGVGVAFYLMLALRIRLREMGWFDTRPEPNFAELLDLVAVGTVADLVPLDYTNRILVNEGLKRIRAGACSTGIKKLIELSGRSMRTLGSQDIAFAVAPRINAAGRLDDMSVGVQTLLAQQQEAALALATELENMNQYRREIQVQMTQQALTMLPNVQANPQLHSYVLYQPEWHEGIVGIIASRIKDLTYRPSIGFAPCEDGSLKGSGRSITGIHLRDMLDLVDKSDPGLIIRFGGHAMAAGLSIEAENLDRFKTCFEQVLRDYVDPACFDDYVEHDGEIERGDMTLELARLLRDASPWGQRFPAPSFQGEFRVLDQKILSDQHIKFVLTSTEPYQPVDAIAFFVEQQQLKTNFQNLRIHYQLSVNEFRGQQSVQLVILTIL